MITKLNYIGGFLALFLMALSTPALASSWMSGTFCGMLERIAHTNYDLTTDGKGIRAKLYIKKANGQYGNTVPLKPLNTSVYDFISALAHRPHVCFKGSIFMSVSSPELHVFEVISPEKGGK